MQWWEYVVLMAFAVGIFVIFGGSAIILGRRVVRRLLRRPAPPPSRWTRWGQRVVLALGGVGALCVAYAFFIEPYRLTQTRVRIACPKLPAGAGPVRIAFLSDLHCVPTLRLEDRVVEAVAAEKPDLILFGGDALGLSGGLENLRRCMAGLARIAPTYAVRGNWDRELPPRGFYERLGVRELENDILELDVRGQRICLAGAGIHSRHRIARTAARLPKDVTTLFLTHYPDQIYEVAGQADLYLCGHTHGGQVALPLYGALITLARHGKRFEYGLYRVDSTALFVSRGVGMEGNHTPPVRFCAPPEVVFLELAPPQ